MDPSPLTSQIPKDLSYTLPTGLHEQLALSYSFSWKLDWRWGVWTLGALIAISALICMTKPESRLSKKIKFIAHRLEMHVSKYSGLYSFLLVSLFFVLASVAKWTQLLNNELHSQDFWLFVDMLDQASKGGAWLTRFAPQFSSLANQASQNIGHPIGWIQHGAIHAFLPMFLLVPLTWLMSAKWVILFLNPISLSLSGLLIMTLTRRYWSGSAALLFGFSFFLSSYVGKVLMYESHPEVLYPLFLLSWAWSMNLGTPNAALFADRGNLSRWNQFGVYASVILLLTLKEDALLVFVPFGFFAVLSLRKHQQEAALGSLVIAVLAYIFQLFSLHQWSKGQWSHETWEGLPVFIPAAAGSQSTSQNWSSIDGFTQLITSIWSKSGGMEKIPVNGLKFLLSRPFLTLLIPFPWLVKRASFWIAVLPISLLYSLNPGPSNLWNYYSAPFIGIFWLSAILAGQALSSASRKRFAIWTLAATCIFGSGGPTWYFSSTQSRESVKKMTDNLIRCKNVLLNSPGTGHFNGFIGAGLIYLLSDEDRSSIATDRVPIKAVLNKLDFALFNPDLERFENSKLDLKRLQLELTASSEWTEIDSSCKPNHNLEVKTTTPGIMLFIRKSRQ